MGNVGKTGPLNGNYPIQPVGPKKAINNAEASPKQAEVLDNKTADELLKKNAINKSDTSANDVSFPTKDDGKMSKQAKIDALSSSLQGATETLKKKLSDNGANDLHETMGVLMKKAKDSLSADDFNKLNNELFPEKETAKSKEYQKMLGDAIEVFKKSDQPEAAMKNLVDYLCSGTVNIVENNPGC